MYDIHCHILPGVDDGPAAVDDAVKMAHRALKAGIQGIVCTPHYIEGRYDGTAEQNLAVLNGFKEHMEKLGIVLKLFCGNEVLMTPSIIELLEQQKITTINNSRYLLIEFPTSCKPLFADDIIYRLRLKGLVPVIAHPERYEWIMEDLRHAPGLVDRGCLIQLNLQSLSGFYGERVKRTARKLLKAGLVHLTGTDCHSAEDSGVKLEKSISMLKSAVPSDTADWIISNSERVVENKLIRAL